MYLPNVTCSTIKMYFSPLGSVRKQQTPLFRQIRSNPPPCGHFDNSFAFCNGLCGLKLNGLVLASYAPFLPSTLPCDKSSASVIPPGDMQCLKHCTTAQQYVWCQPICHTVASSCPDGSILWRCWLGGADRTGGEDEEKSGAGQPSRVCY